MTTKIWYIIISILIAGMYIDMAHGDICNGNYKQRALTVQTIVPFHSDRQHVYLAYGSKEYQAIDETIIDYYRWDEEGNRLQEPIVRTRVSSYGCAVKKNFNYPEEQWRIVDFRPWSEPKAFLTEIITDRR